MTWINKVAVWLLPTGGERICIEIYCWKQLILGNLCKMMFLTWVINRDLCLRWQKQHCWMLLKREDMATLYSFGFLWTWIQETHRNRISGRSVMLLMQEIASKIQHVSFLSSYTTHRAKEKKRKGDFPLYLWEFILGNLSIYMCELSCFLLCWRFAFSEAMKKMYGIKQNISTLPSMPADGGTWSVMHSWVLPTRSFLEFVMFSRFGACVFLPLHSALCRA